MALQAIEKTHTFLKASLYSSLAIKGAGWVFESDGQGESGRGRDISETFCLRAVLGKEGGKADH